MTVVGIGSVRGAPGVTTTSMLLTGALTDAALVEADLAGGAIASRYSLGREPGLTTVAASVPLAPGEWRNHAQDAGGVATITGPDSPASARGLWRRAGTQLAVALAGSDTTMVADLGRIGDDTPLIDEVALLVLLVRPVTEHLVTLSHHLPTLRSRADRVGVVLVGDGAYRAADVAGPLEVEVLGALPHDQRAADALCGGGSALRLARSRLVRAASGLAGAIEDLLPDGTAPVEVTR